ncbi:78 kDa glucose-regulated protein [Elysia marginata]|uniref:78 kDa glucose-regulated protein n=1 Tax=Elysia marginata TaxID=1093978 RepID=A0AAV4GU13_9GAST|nr:78 kDa glucose-regulated protein [Elysia marginata]
MEYFIKLYTKKKGKDIGKDNCAVQKLRREVGKAKRALSLLLIMSSWRLSVSVTGRTSLTLSTGAKFEEHNIDLFRSTMKSVKQVLEDADLNVNDIDEIVLV